MVAAGSPPGGPSGRSPNVSGHSVSGDIKAVSQIQFGDGVLTEWPVSAWGLPAVLFLTEVKNIKTVYI